MSEQFFYGKTHIAGIRTSTRMLTILRSRRVVIRFTNVTKTAARVAAVYYLNIDAAARCLTPVRFLGIPRDSRDSRDSMRFDEIHESMQSSENQLYRSRIAGNFDSTKFQGATTARTRADESSLVP